MKNRALVVACAVVGLLFGVSANGVFAGKAIFGKGTNSELERAKTISTEIMRGQALSRGLVGGDEVSAERVTIDELKMAHTRFRQNLNGVPVWEGEAIVHLKSDGSLDTITDDLKGITAIDTKPSLTEGDALNVVAAFYKGFDRITEAPEIGTWIYQDEGRTRLVYRIQLTRLDGSKETSMPVFFIDAHSGEKVFQYENLQTQSVTGTGATLYSGNRSIGTFRSGATYYMENTVRRVGTFDNRSTTTSSFRFTDADNIWNSAAQRAGADAHWGAEQTMNYFQNVHGRNGINGSGGPAFFNSINGVGLISSKVHYGASYNNAGWTGSHMIYGDGDGVTFSPLVSIDVCGHEFTHGVTQFTANLTYANQSGALNESMSDVFGALIERFGKGASANNWRIGEEIYTPATAGDALRFMDNPHSASNKGFTADDDPDHFVERYTGTADSGGVHINSGIPNKVFYLLAQGGSHHRGGSMTGIGADAAARIWYRALTLNMTSGTNFAGARTATINAANALFGAGSVQSNATAQAWTLCGI